MSKGHLQWQITTISTHELFLCRHGWHAWYMYIWYKPFRSTSHQSWHYMSGILSVICRILKIQIVNVNRESFIYLDCECSTDAVWISVFINVNQGCFVYRDYECLTRVVLYVQITNVLPNYFISRLRIFTWGCLYISIMNA